MGGYNLHVYEILKCIYGNGLEKTIVSDEPLSTMMNERYSDNVFMFKWDIYVITNMLWLTNKKHDQVNEKVSSCEFIIFIGKFAEI